MPETPEAFLHRQRARDAHRRRQRALPRLVHGAARIPQLQSSFAAIWDDVLPPLPEDVRRANLEMVARELNRAA